MMYGDVIQRLAEEYDVRVAFLCNAGTPGHFSDPLTWYDELRLKHIREFGDALNLVLWLDFWSSGWFCSHNFEDSLDLLLEGSSQRRALIFGGPPLLPIPKSQGGKNAFTNYVYQKFKEEGNFAFLLRMREDAAGRHLRLSEEKRIQSATSNPKYDGRAKFAEVFSYFESTEEQTIKNGPSKLGSTKKTIM